MYIYACAKIHVYSACIYMYVNILYLYNGRKFRSQISDNTDRWKSKGWKSQRRKEKKKENQRRERSRRKKMQVREKVDKSRNTTFFPMFWGSVGSKSRIAKAAGVEPSGEIRRERLHAVVARSKFQSQHVKKKPHVRSTFWSWDVEKVYAVVAREAHIEVKSVKNWRSRSTFGSWDVENGHAVVARRTFPRKNVQNTSGPENFWQLRSRKNAQRCGAKHISKVKIVN